MERVSDLHKLLGRAWERPAVDSACVAWSLGRVWERPPVDSALFSLVTASGDLNIGFDIMLRSPAMSASDGAPKRTTRGTQRHLAGK